MPVASNYDVTPAMTPPENQPIVSYVRLRVHDTKDYVCSIALLLTKPRPSVQARQANDFSSQWGRGGVVLT